MSADPKSIYESLKGHVERKSHGHATRDLLLELIEKSILAINQSERRDLTSRVPGKMYYAVCGDGRRSRPINTGLFDPDASLVVERMTQILERRHQSLSAQEITATIYTAAISFCAYRDITSDNDQKTPGTYFEYLCAAVMTSILKVPSRTSLSVLNLGMETSLPTDFIFDLGDEKPKFHVPVKTSTRERVIQVWAHQRVLDGVYGTGRFLGLPIVLAETKTTSRTDEVTEICLPKQWRLYQMHVAQMWRIAYLDIPAAYLPLATVFPPVPVVTLGELLVNDGDVTKLVEKHGDANLSTVASTIANSPK